MTDLDTRRKRLNKQQTELRKVMTSFKQHTQAIKLFMAQHAALHSAQVSGGEHWSFEDEILGDMTEAQIRRIPRNCEQSVIWQIWHIARIEDITMNLLVANRPQLFLQENWSARLEIDVMDTGNAMSVEEIGKLSERIDIQAVRTYRQMVGQRTREIVSQLQADDLKAPVEPARLDKVMEQGALVEEARPILDYWSKRNIAGLLLMPATRHNLVHLNEALRLKLRRD